MGILNFFKAQDTPAVQPEPLDDARTPVSVANMKAYNDTLDARIKQLEDTKPPAVSFPELSMEELTKEDWEEVLEKGTKTKNKVKIYSCVRDRNLRKIELIVGSGREIQRWGSIAKSFSYFVIPFGAAFEYPGNNEDLKVLPSRPIFVNKNPEFPWPMYESERHRLIFINGNLSVGIIGDAANGNFWIEYTRELNDYSNRAEEPPASFVGYYYLDNSLDGGLPSFG